jgi:effector-binding domain-containing protein
MVTTMIAKALSECDGPADNPTHADPREIGITPPARDARWVMGYDVRVLSVEPIPIAVIRDVASASQLSAVVPGYCGEVWKFVKSNAIPDPDRHVAVYHDDAIHLEVGAIVGGPFVGDGRVVPSTTPGGTVATTTHVGPYQRLGDAHRAIVDWCAANGRTPAGVNWEIYGHWTDDPEGPRTDVFYLLRPVGDGDVGSLGPEPTA